MRQLTNPSDLDYELVKSVAWEGERCTLSDELREKIDKNREQFLKLIEDGVPCYGVTTGLGKLVEKDLDTEAKHALPANMLRARAAAIGEPWPVEVVRAMMIIRLVNFISGRDGVRALLCEKILDLLNNNIHPWVPKLGHGMAADAIANTHAFQILIGEGFVIDEDNTTLSATKALRNHNIEAFDPLDKEGLALINGVTVAPALAMAVEHRLEKLLNLATAVSAVSVEGMRAPKDPYDQALIAVTKEPGTCRTIRLLNYWLEDGNTEPYKLQSPISYRIIPQVHGACHDTLQGLKQTVIWLLDSFSGNPLLTDELPPRLLSVGSFQSQHLANQLDAVAIGLAHVGQLSEKRFHRMMNPENTGLNAQLAMRPGLDAGLVVAHKACIDICARLKLLANPVTLSVSDTSMGQEDYMSLAVPAAERLFEMAALVEALLAYEMLGGSTAVQQNKVKVSQRLEPFIHFCTKTLEPYTKDRSPGPDVELILYALRSTQIETHLTDAKNRL